MNKLRVINLLNKIANGEEVPKKIEYAGIVFRKTKENDYINEIKCSLFEHKFDGCELLLPILNEEIEIIEEDKKIEKLRVNYEIDEDSEIDSFKATTLECHIADKINEIIDYIKEKE